MPKELGLKFMLVIREDGIDTKGKPGDITGLFSMLKNPKFSLDIALCLSYTPTSYWNDSGLYYNCQMKS